MGRYLLGLVLLTLIGTGCDRAKFSAVPPEQQSKATAAAPANNQTWPEEEPTTNTPIWEEAEEPFVPPTSNTTVNPPQQPGQQPVFIAPPSVKEPEPRCIGNSCKRVVTCGEGTACPKTESIAGQCEPVPFTGEAKIEKVDHIFVVDTSASLRGGKTGNGGELAQIARDLPSYFESLDPRTDPNIAVILGHGPNSSRHGKLFKSSRGEPLVLRYAEYFNSEKRRGGSDTEVRKRAVAKMAKDMETKLMAPRAEINESKGAQGEALLWSLYTAITRNKAQFGDDLLRKDAVMQVTFVTDEQDVCFDYDDPKQNPTGAKPVAKEADGGPDKYEVETLKACRQAGITPSLVYNALVGLGQPKLLLGAIAYLNATVEANPDKEDENERGYGVLNLIDIADKNLGSAIRVNLGEVKRGEGTVSFSDELAYIGRETKMQMAYANPIACRPDGIHPSAIDTNTILVRVVDGQGKVLAKFSPGCKGGSQCPGGAVGWAKGEVNGRDLIVRMQSTPLTQLFDFLSEKKISSGAFQVTFKTLRGMNPRTGRLDD